MKLVISLLFVSSGLLSAATVSIPFSTNFDAFADSDTLPSDFVETNAGTANSIIISGNLRQSLSGTGSANSSASVAVTPGTFTAAGGFTTSTTFTIDAYTIGTSGVMNVSLSANGTNTDLGAGGAYRLIYTLSTTSGPGTGALILQETGTAPFGLTAIPGSSLTSATGIAPGAGGSQTFTLSLVGVYTSGGASISLTGTLTNGTTTLTIGATDSTPTGGNNFGIRSAIGSSTTSSTETVTFTNYNLATIPEPASLAILGASIGLFGLRRKRA